MHTELYIERQEADINLDLASLLTFALEDISYEGFGSRQTSFSKTIILPGTAKNNRLLGNVFELAVSNPYNPDSPNIGINFNPSVAANCLVFQDAIQAFKGTIRITKIVIDKGVIEYETALTGELYKLNIALSSNLLEALDFSAYNHVYTASNIIASWDNAGGAGYYYPNIDYGLYSVNKHDWDIRTFRPALYVKEYIDKMFMQAGFTYNCPLFNTSRFKGLIVPHNQKQLTTVEAYNLDVRVTNGGLFDYNDTMGGSVLVPYGTHIIEQDYTNNTDSTVFTYTGADLSGTYEILMVGQWRKNISFPFTISVLKNGTPLSSGTFESSASSTYVTFTYKTTGGIILTNGDTLAVRISQAVSTDFDIKIVPGTSYIRVKVPGGAAVVTQPGDTVKVNESSIPKNIKQVDFLTSIIKLFNLYVWEDKDVENLVHIAPYVDYYSASTLNALDWSYKVNRKEPVTILPLSEITSKTYLFKYKDDSDYYNDTYKKRYNQNYGSRIFDTSFNFVNGQITIELIFAPTPLVGYAGEDKVYSTILKLSNGTEDRTDSVIRILQSKKIIGVTSWNIKDGTTVLASTTAYGYAGHFNSPDTIQDDLNFGALEELFFVAVAGNLTVNQFNVYWSSYMAEITDKDSKLLTAKFRLTINDILNLDFSKYIYIDGSLFRLYKITDYNLTAPDESEVNLLKVINTVY